MSEGCGVSEGSKTVRHWEVQNPSGYKSTRLVYQQWSRVPNIHKEVKERYSQETEKRDVHGKELNIAETVSILVRFYAQEEGER